MAINVGWQIWAARHRDEVGWALRPVRLRRKPKQPTTVGLNVVLVGGRLEHVAVTVTILDGAGQDHWTRGLPDGVNQAEAEAEAFVWGG